ncbi:hypothetical protein V1512DRAFT_263637 [Lipomyces arxii]|uniref:uncharacterized protein n=1 Tax=Lipomyces arxii TaxID=56418 RepID=UPI0034CF6F5C
MPLLLLALIPIAGVVVAAVAGGTHYVNSQLSPSKIQPVIREMPQSGLTSYTLRPQFRLNNKLLNVYSRTGTKLFRFVRHQAAPEVQGVTYSLLDGRDAHPLSTIHIGGLKSQVLFHASAEMVENPGLVEVHHVVADGENFRVFILPDGTVYQWTRQRFLEKVHTKPGSNQVEVREQIAVARRIGTRIWEIKFDERQLAADIVMSTCLISIFDQWNTIWGVGGIYFKSDKHLAAKYS